ncbi:MAG: hypothetical protein HC845_15050 [Akkermansiaceae bacterium]|nr:hypothetical protein [Akkermansiaceae bacterium]
MSFPIRIAFISAIVAASSLVSCTTVSKVGKGSMAIAQSATKATTSGVAKLSTAVTDKISPSGVKVVEVREKDLKVMPTGKEKLLALEAKQDRMAARAASRKNSRSWFFNGPVDFTEPALPPIEGEMDGSLLPPIN